MLCPAATTLKSTTTTTTTTTYTFFNIASTTSSAEQEEPYTAPVQLSGVEAVLARCGEQERLLTRIAAVRQRLPPEPPLALRPGAAGSDGGQGSGSSGGGTEEAGRPAGGAASGGQPERLNVLILFLDSLGRRHFFRRMPRSAAAVEAVARRGASSLHQFFRYHVTGFHTDPNTHVMYTGSPFENQRAWLWACQAVAVPAWGRWRPGACLGAAAVPAGGVGRSALSFACPLPGALFAPLPCPPLA